jgi:hypothetical protein
MAATSRTRLVNPRLGTYFGIFAAALISLVLMALMLERLGVSDGAVRYLMFAGPMEPSDSFLQRARPMTISRVAAGFRLSSTASCLPSALSAARVFSL